jgi:hypothetical protein
MSQLKYIEVYTLYEVLNNLSAKQLKSMGIDSKGIAKYNQADRFADIRDYIELPVLCNTYHCSGKMFPFFLIGSESKVFVLIDKSQNSIREDIKAIIHDYYNNFEIGFTEVSEVSEDYCMDNKKGEYLEINGKPVKYLKYLL